MKRSLFTLLFSLLAAPSSAGVVFEIETQDHDFSPPRSERTLVYAEGLTLKLDNIEGQRGISDSMIFRGDRRELVVVDHEKRSYLIIDKQFAENIAGQLGQLSGRMSGRVQGMLDNVPPEQRAMIEQVMNDPPQQNQLLARPQLQVSNTGKQAMVYGYPCVLFRVASEGRTVRDVWVTNWNNIQGGRALAATFDSMSDFFQELMSLFPLGADAPMEDNAFASIREMGGFPVATREYREDGTVESESALRSAQTQSINLADLQPPTNYQLETMPSGNTVQQ